MEGVVVGVMRRARMAPRVAWCCGLAKNSYPPKDGRARTLPAPGLLGPFLWLTMAIYLSTTSRRGYDLVARQKVLLDRALQRGRRRGWVTDDKDDCDSSAGGSASSVRAYHGDSKRDLKGKNLWAACAFEAEYCARKEVALLLDEEATVGLWWSLVCPKGPPPTYEVALVMQDRIIKQASKVPESDPMDHFKMRTWALHRYRFQWGTDLLDERMIFERRYSSVDWCRWCDEAMTLRHLDQRKHNLRFELAWALNRMLGDPRSGRRLFCGPVMPAPEVVTLQGLEDSWGPELMHVGAKAMMAIEEAGGISLRSSKDEENMGDHGAGSDLLPCHGALPD